VAFEQQGLRVSRIASADLSAKQYTFVKLTTSSQLASCGAGDPMIGILQDNPLANVAGSVMYAGVSRLKVDGSGTAIAAQDNLKADSSARGVKTTTNGDEVGAIALEAATTANAIIAVLVVRYRY
jgi:hypothetical protein